MAVNGRQRNFGNTPGVSPRTSTLCLIHLPDLTQSNTFLFADDIKIYRPIMIRDDQSIHQQDVPR